MSKTSMIKTSIGNSAGKFFRFTNNIFLKNSLTVFAYHDVSDHPDEFSRTYHLNVPPDIFDYQISFIKSNFNIISPDDLINARIPQKAALITFDDGFRSVFTNAIPILGKHDVPSIIFLNMETVKGGLFCGGLITYLCTKQQDFISHLKANLPSPAAGKRKTPLYLSCTKEIVQAYLKKADDSIHQKVGTYTGKFAGESDLKNAADKDLVYYGNHLYDHYVPLLMSDNDLLNSYSHNATQLNQYENYRDMFAFPYGQPGTCFSRSQANLLLENGAKKVFTTHPVINFSPASRYLHRIPLTSSHDSADKIWFKICQRSFREHLHLC